MDARLVLSSDDPEIPLPFAAFRMNRDSSMIPAKMSLEVLGDLCLPFGQGETWNAERRFDFAFQFSRI